MISQDNKLENVAIFVDYDNVYWTLMNNYSFDPGCEDPNHNLIDCLWKKYKRDYVRTFRVYADFEKVKSNLSAMQQKRIQIRHVYSNGIDGNFNKNSSDIELCIDAIETTYKDPSITCYVFVTADSDVIPILSRMMYKGKRVELYYLSKAAPQYVDLASYAHFSMDLLEFLEIKEQRYNVEDYMVETLKFINNWHKIYDGTDKFLGSSWLCAKLAERFDIPANISKEVMEQLRVNECIIGARKELIDGTVKTSISLTSKGETLIENTQEAAVANEEWLQ